MVIQSKLLMLCSNIEGTKVRIRRESCSELRDFLRENDTKNYILQNLSCCKNILNSIQIAMKHDAVKLLSERKKIGLSSESVNTSSTSGDLFADFMQLITGYNAEFSFKNLLCFMDSSVVKNCYQHIFLKIIQEYFLGQAHFRKSLDSEDWLCLFLYIKSFFQTRTNLETQQIECLTLLIKWGSNHSFPVYKLREEFDQIKQTFDLASISSPLSFQLSALRLVNEFCIQTAADNRMACCKLGEEIFPKILQFYDYSKRDSEIKSNCIKFCNLQMILHHPKGATIDHPASYAVSEMNWKNFVGSLYSFLINDIEITQSSSLHHLSYQKNEIKYFNSDFVTLFVEVARQNFLSVKVEEVVEGPSCKRARTDSSFNSILINIKTTQSWTWISLTASLLKTYPNLIATHEFVELLENLVNLMKDTTKKDLTLKHHVYEALFVLKTIQKSISAEKNKEIDELWTILAQILSRSVTLNQHEEQNHKLLNLLMNLSRLQPDVILRPYRTGTVANLTEFNLETISVAFEEFPSLQSDDCLKYDLMKWILKENNFRKHHLKQTAKVLVNLILKQPPKRILLEETTAQREYETIENLYFTISLESFLFDGQKTKQISEEQILCHDSNILNKLKGLLSTFAENENSFEKKLNLMILIFNILNFFVQYKIFTEDEVFANKLWKLFENSSNKVFDFVENSGISILESYSGVLDKFDSIFSNKENHGINKKFREIVPTNFIKFFFDVINASFQNETEIIYKTKSAKILINYSLGLNFKMEMQEMALSALVETDYNYERDTDFQLGVSIIQAIIDCNLTSFSEEIVVSVYNLMQNISSHRYQCSLSTLRILKLFSELVPFVFKSKYGEYKSKFVEMLFIFYSMIKRYPPEVVKSILHCIGVLYEADSDCTFLRFNNEEVILKLPEFLYHNCVAVRFAAIKEIARFFKISSQNHQLHQFHLQEIMFSKIQLVNDTIFEMDGEPTSERLVDEILTKSASVLQTFASIMINSHLWISQSIVSLYKIQSIQIKLTEKTLIKVSKELHFNTVLEFLGKYLQSVFSLWSFEKIEQFPFNIYKTKSKLDFFAKYWNILAPTIIEKDANSLKDIYSKLGLNNMVELVTELSPRLLSICIVENACNGNISNFKTFRLLVKCFGDEAKLFNLLDTEIETILLEIIEFVSDENDFMKQFEENVLFPKLNEIHLNVHQFRGCLDFIEETAYENESLISHLLKNCSSKLHNVFLEILSRISSSKTIEEKLKYLHIYTILSTYCIESLLLETHKAQEFFLRNIFYSLLHLIKDKNESELRLTSGKFLKILFEKLLPKFTETVKKFFVIITSRLKTLAVENIPKISFLCNEILNIFFVTYGNEFLSEITQNSTPKQYLSLFKKNTRNLRLEVKQFVDFVEKIENVNECEASLINLKESLRSNKQELDEKFENLHRLVCTLIKLCYSDNSKVCKEALNCLGEIGSRNFGKLVLQPESPIPAVSLTPWELFSSGLLVLLSTYLVDCDVRVAKSATKALKKLLSTKEARKIAVSENDYGFGSVPIDYVEPFFAQNMSRSSFNIKLNREMFLEKIAETQLWVPKTEISHENWIINLVSNLFECCEENDIFLAFIDVCKLKVDFCEKILPLLIFNLIFCNIAFVTETLSQKIGSFFHTHWTITVITKDSAKSITTNKDSLQIMLNVVDFVRLQENNRTKKPSRSLELDYLKAAKAAQFCNCHFLTILFCELWCEQFYNNNTNVSGTKLDAVLESIDKTTGNALQNILRDSYKTLGENDALSGCGTFYLTDHENRIEHFKEIGKWDQVIHHYQMRALQGEKKFLLPLMESLKQCDYLELPLFYKNEFEDSKYECLWRLGEWSHKSEENSLRKSCDQFKFEALKAIHEQDEFSFTKSITGMRNSLVDELKNVTFDTTTNFYTTMTQIQSLKELEDFSQAIKDETGLNDLVKAWKSDAVSNEYQYIEPIKAQRMVILTKFCHFQENKGEIVEFLLDFSEYARLEGHSNVASRVLNTLLRLPNLPSEIHTRIKLEQAQICWSIQDVSSTKCILKELCMREEDPRLRAIALKMTGEYLAESCLENRQIIIDNYFLKSIALLKDFKQYAKDQKLTVDAYDKLAKFVDREYQQVMEHVKSDMFQRKLDNLEKTKSSMSGIALGAGSTPDLKKSVVIKQKQCALDELEIQEIEKEKNHLLKLALKYYLLTLIHSDEQNISIFRLISLLLENKQNPIVKSVMAKELHQIPTYKFIPILPQLMPHIYSPNDSSFSGGICLLIERCATQHPHHTLPFILSLAYANKDREYFQTSKKVENDARTKSAKKLLSSLEHNEELASLIKRMKFLSEALIELAYAELNTQKFTKSLKINKVKEFENVLLPTCHIPVRTDSVYENYVGIHAFEDVFENVGGLNAPKKIICIGTDGVKRTQLIKGRDDLRQDAVMEQVFTIMNSLLSINKQTKNLRIRTYKIVPLSMRSGILEWVDNSMTIGEYLAGDGKKIQGAHAKYRPEDRLPSQCRSDFSKIASYTLEKKTAAYEKICGNIQPVFHNFFLSTFPQASLFFEKRLAYIHSVATSSMCGYILGIGDRHVNNILIDKDTAELIHIDFGIAFEQGRILPTPETIPFRLTRDIVDGMGISGVEGVFRRSCEKTVEVLRLNHNTIMTILEVLLYDPLYDWTVSSNEAKKRQRRFEQDENNDTNTTIADSCFEGSNSANVTAERALLRLKSKLQGTETGKLTTVQHQVNTLIQQAIDPANLCRLYNGWQPYL